MLSIDTIMSELQSAVDGAGSAAPGSVNAGALTMAPERFEELRADAAATCRASRGARVAAMQIEGSPCDARGARHILDLLKRVTRDQAPEPHAA
jgi:hypothetical protein